MKCRSCGTEIADKAIVCYRCGTGTTEPVRKPAAVPPARRPLPWVVLAIVLVAAALGLWVESDAMANPAVVKLAAVVLAVAGIGLFGVARRR
jgi:hypothetical protein